MVKSRHDEHTKQQAVSRYLAGENSGSLAAEFMTTKSTLLKWVRAAGGTVRTNMQSRADQLLSVNHGAFAAPSEARDYWAGFMMADGNITTSAQAAPQLFLNLKWDDLEHVEKFRAFLGSAHAIRKVGSVNPVASFAVRSRRLSDDLGQLGVTPRKSHSAQARGDVLTSRHFWRGVVDGDGSLHQMTNGADAISLVGAEPLVNQFLDYLRQAGVISDERRAHQDAGERVWRVRFQGERARVIIKHLYQDAEVYLERKMERARAVLK